MSPQAVHRPDVRHVPRARRARTATVAIEELEQHLALLDQLDLLIAVDTGVVHLAGAMGRPVWVLLPHFADWRWLTGREDSPWYPTMRLFRQPAPGDWGSIVRRVAAALTA